MLCPYNLYVTLVCFTFIGMAVTSINSKFIIIIFLSRVRPLCSSDFTKRFSFLSVRHLFHLVDYIGRRSSNSWSIHSYWMFSPFFPVAISICNFESDVYFFSSIFTSIVTAIRPCSDCNRSQTNYYCGSQWTISFRFITHVSLLQK
jgi:hypothetical protein